MRRPRTLTAAATLVILGVSAVVAYTHLRSPRLTSELRGHALADQLGCFACHGPGATGGVPNPGSDEAEIPSWDGGTSMMYVESEEEIREWILYGRPERLSRQTSDDKESAVHMPAYEALISEENLEDLVAYYKAVARYGDMPTAALEGYRAARKNGCFGCHGPGGLVGAKNPRSFKGYIPPWRGRDYADLVRNDDELRQWILEGEIDRFAQSRLASFFTRRQLIQMPAYSDRLTEEEVESIITYISWLQQ